jgi:hypothetical protein
VLLEAARRAAEGKDLDAAGRVNKCKQRLDAHNIVTKLGFDAKTLGGRLTELPITRDVVPIVDAYYCDKPTQLCSKCNPPFTRRPSRGRSGDGGGAAADAALCTRCVELVIGRCRNAIRVAFGRVLEGPGARNGQDTWRLRPPRSKVGAPRWPECGATWAQALAYDAWNERRKVAAISTEQMRRDAPSLGRDEVARRLCALGEDVDPEDTVADLVDQLLQARHLLTSGGPPGPPLPKERERARLADQAAKEWTATAAAAAAEAVAVAAAAAAAVRNERALRILVGRGTVKLCTCESVPCLPECARRQPGGAARRVQAAQEAADGAKTDADCANKMAMMANKRAKMAADAAKDWALEAAEYRARAAVAAIAVEVAEPAHGNIGQRICTKRKRGWDGVDEDIIDEVRRW